MNVPTIMADQAQPASEKGMDAARKAQRESKVPALVSWPEPWMGGPTHWSFRGKEYPDADAAKDAQQKEILAECIAAYLSAAPRALPADAVGEILASHLDLQKLIEGGECKPTELAMVAHRHRATLLQQNARLTTALAEAKAENGDLWDGLKRACENCEAFDWESYRDGFDVEDAVGFLKQDHNDLVTALAEERAKGERMATALRAADAVFVKYGFLQNAPIRIEIARALEQFR